MSVDSQIHSAMHEPLLSANNFHSLLARSKSRLQRITVTETITAELASENALLLDVSLSGALLAHQTPHRKGERVTMRFDWHGRTVHAEVEVMRTEVDRSVIPGSHPIYRSGVAFRRHLNGSEQVLRAMVTELVERELDERRAAKIRRYLTLRLVRGMWQKAETTDPTQPADGFTVSIEEGPRLIKLLCRTFERLSENDHEVVRKIASLSTAK